MTIARLPLANDLDDFTFEGTPINATQTSPVAGLARDTNGPA
jgi:hypothetical protein